MSINTNGTIQYKPIKFIISVFTVTWICAVLMTKVDYETHSFLFTLIDFIESASPLIFALILLRSFLLHKGNLFHFFLGERKSLICYVIVLALFVGQYLNFYLFSTDKSIVTMNVFFVTFISQLLLGGGLEEAGWRGYLLPALRRKFPVLLASLFVSLIWVVWHLPYFFLPGMHMGGDFISYTIIGVVTGFILTAIYMLTKSVLLCTLFHSWQNTIVMVVPADMQNPGFLLTFLLLGIVSVIICQRMKEKGYHDSIQS